MSPIAGFQMTARPPEVPTTSPCLLIAEALLPVVLTPSIVPRSMTSVPRSGPQVTAW